ncbi:MAG: Sec-independent protein translocase subunit TatA [Neisseriaceae bacterium]
MGSFSIWHWLLVLLVIVLIFGTSKLKTLGKDLGESVRNFKQSLNEEKKENLDRNKKD